MDICAPGFRVNYMEKCHQSWSKILEIFTNCLSDVTVLRILLFILSCSLAGYWQTQSFCFHKELMKRTIGKATYAFEARDYVVSVPVTARSFSHGTGTNPIDVTKTGDPHAFCYSAPPGNEILAWETPTQAKKPNCISSTTGSFIRKMCMKKGTKLPTDNQTA